MRVLAILLLLFSGMCMPPAPAYPEPVFEFVGNEVIAPDEARAAYSFMLGVLGVDDIPPFPVLVEGVTREKMCRLTNLSMTECPRGIYMYRTATIYLTPEADICVFIHEIAHVFIQLYFTDEVPMTMQEIWAGYVEYKYRKFQESQ